VGAGVAVAATERTSVGPGGVEANGLSANPDISADGRIVAFAADATNLVAGDANGARDIFVRDRATGATGLVSINNLGAQAGAASFFPSVSADGRFVAFESGAANLVTGDGNGDRDIFVRDLLAGTTERVSLNSIGNGGNSGSGGGAAIDADGSQVAFGSNATNLVLGDANGQMDVFVRDRATGLTERVSLGPGGLEANGPSMNPSVSGDARFVAFASDATNLVSGDTNGVRDVFVRDRTTGVTERVNTGEGGAEVKSPSGTPEISADGQVVVFTSPASKLVEDDTNKRPDVFAHDRGSGVTQLVSVGLEGVSAKGSSAFPKISADGRYVAFESLASNLVVEDDNKRSDIFVRDRTAGTTERVSLTNGGAQADGRSINAAVTGDGRFTAFESFAKNLVASDANEVGDVFVRERPPPVIGESVSVLPVEGEVLVAVPAKRSAHAAAGVPGLKGLKFVPLERVRSIPVGSFFDTRDGKVSLKSAADSKGKIQSGSFAAGVFQVLQKRKGREKGLTTLKLKGASFSRCRSGAQGKSSVARAARRKLSSKTVRRLSGSAKGSFRTRGRHSSATVRGTVWVTSDRCDGTLTKVKRGKVAVRDFRRKRTVTVRAGKSYLAPR
jgi:Tol biopolymer transport system component